MFCAGSNACWDQIRGFWVHPGKKPLEGSMRTTSEMLFPKHKALEILYPEQVKQSILCWDLVLRAIHDPSRLMDPIIWSFLSHVQYARCGGIL